MASLAPCTLKCSCPVVCMKWETAECRVRCTGSVEPSAASGPHPFFSRRDQQERDTDSSLLKNNCTDGLWFLGEGKLRGGWVLQKGNPAVTEEGLHSYHYTARAPYKNCPICLNGKSWILSLLPVVLPSGCSHSATNSWSFPSKVAVASWNIKWSAILRPNIFLLQSNQW